MKIQILIDNRTKNELISEWGLAVYIEYNGHKVLLDTGATGKFVKNAEALSIDLNEIEFGVLSHAHYDHSDGLESFFEKNNHCKFYFRDVAEENCYVRKWIFNKYIGIQKGITEKYVDRIKYVKGDYEVITGVTLIPHKTDGLEKIGKKSGMYIRKKHKWYPDSFAHEQSLVFDTEKGLVIFNSCSHGGADNIIIEIQETYPDKKIYALVGGFHLYVSSESDVRGLAKRIRDTGIERVYTGHCTGKRAFNILKEELGDKVAQIYTGMEIEI